MRYMPLIITASLAALAITNPGPAKSAAILETPFTQTVETEDLDLTTPRDARRLEARIRTRIRQACASGSRDSASLQLERQCRDSAYSAAERAMTLAIAEAKDSSVRLAAQPQAQPEG